VKYDPKQFDTVIEEHADLSDPVHPMRKLVNQFLKDRGLIVTHVLQDILFNFGQYVTKQ
jgi:hypothetical protein